MINEDDLAGLAGLEPEQQFRLVERLATQKLTERDQEGPYYDDYDYMSSVLEAARVFGVDELLQYELPSRNDEQYWRTICRNFRGDATRVSQRILFQYASRPAKDPNTVALDAATKEKLRFHLGQVRALVDKEDLPAWKKDALYSAIAALEAEIDKARTRLTAVLDVVGEAWDGSKSVSDALRAIVAIVQGAKKAERETAQLGAPAAHKQLEARKEPLALPKPKKRPRSPGDDEIPF